ncbi:MAG: EI24 domain-containing protein [Rickettsiales bacterium]
MKLIAKAIDSFFSRPILTLAGWTAGLSILGFALLLGLITWILGATSILTTGWMDTTVDILAGAVGFILAWFLFPVTTVLIASFFADAAAERIERLEYNITEKREVSLWQEIKGGISFAATAIALNLICIPLYFIPLINVVTYYTLNSYLLGREFFEMVTIRHLDVKEGKTLFRQNRWKVMMAGLVVAFASTLPILNLFSPILAVALMTHLFQQIRAN